MNNLLKEQMLVFLLSVNMILFSFGCETEDTAVPGSGGDSDSDSDTDSDSDSDTDADTDADADGCGGVDFLFVIDSSRSMGDEQANVIASFSGFIDTIVSTLELNDSGYHILAIDSDDAFGGGYQAGSCGTPTCCQDSLCLGKELSYLCTNSNNVQQSCAMWLGGTCGNELGGGFIGEIGGTVCPNVSESIRYLQGNLTVQQLTDGFQCIGDVGITGSGEERMMEAMTEAIGPLAETGKCNEGFLRKDAILVVTFITDEEDKHSAGDPASWKQALLDAKAGDVGGLVIIGIFGDNDLPSHTCATLETPSGTTGAEAAPKLRQFLESFPENNSQYCNVCDANYNQCFDDAVSVIDTTCKIFVPPV